MDTLKSKIMKTKISLIFIVIIFSLLTSCNDDVDDGDLTPVEFVLIGQGNLYGNGGENIEKQNLKINKSADWNKLVDKMNSNNNVSDGFTEIDIDFSEFMIIAVFDEVKGNGGHSIDITRIEENNNKVFVTIENLLSGGAYTVMSQPYHIVKIPKNNKQVIFEYR